MNQVQLNEKELSLLWSKIWETTLRWVATERWVCGLKIHISQECDFGLKFPDLNLTMLWRV